MIRSTSAVSVAFAVSLASVPALAQRALPATFDAVTVDNIAGLLATATAIQQLASAKGSPWMARVVFDLSESAQYYTTALQSLDRVGYVMAEILDSSSEKNVTVAQSNARVDEYLNTLGASVDLWEVGNEVNGSWTGNQYFFIA